MFQTCARAGNVKKVDVAPAQHQMLQRREGATINYCHPRAEAKTVPGASRCSMAGECHLASVNKVQSGEEVVRQDLWRGRSQAPKRVCIGVSVPERV